MKISFAKGVVVAALLAPAQMYAASLSGSIRFAPYLTIVAPAGGTLEDAVQLASDVAAPIERGTSGPTGTYESHGLSSPTSLSGALMPGNRDGVFDLAGPKAFTLYSFTWAGSGQLLEYSLVSSDFVVGARNPDFLMVDGTGVAYIKYADGPKAGQNAYNPSQAGWHLTGARSGEDIGWDLATFAWGTPLPVTVQPEDLTVFVGDDAQFSFTISGVSPPVCQWRWNGNIIPGATNSTLFLPSVQTNAAGRYTASATNPIGTVLSAEATLSVLRTKQVSKGTIALDVPTGGVITNAGEVHEWSFFGRAGGQLVIVEDQGTNASSSLGYAEVELVGPTNAILGSATNIGLGVGIFLRKNGLPADGTYFIRVRAPAAHPLSTGSYSIALWDVSPGVAPLMLNKPHNGCLETPYSVDYWTFSASRNQQIEFSSTNSAGQGVIFELRGPSGWVGFTNVSSSSGLITLPASGTYTLSAHTERQTVGINYAFTMKLISQVTVPVGEAVAGELVGSGQAQLFKVVADHSVPMVFSLSLGSSTAKADMYVRFGSPPTRGDYERRYEGAASQLESILVPLATQGDWYVLVYCDSVAGTTPFSFQAQGHEILISSVSPTTSGAGVNTVLTVQGVGFSSASTVALVAGNGTAYTASSSSLDLIGELTAYFNSNTVPAGLYSVRVTDPAYGSATLSNAFTMIASGQPKLVTDLVVPSAVGYHATATIYIEYSNQGNAAMPAPLLLLTATQDDTNHLAFLTLDASKLTQGFWTSADPEGFSHSIQLLASGATPGVLQPGDSFRVPVYYAGWQQAPAIYGGSLYGWNPAHTPITFNLGVLTADNSNSVNWASLKDGMQPSTMSTQAWSAVWTNFTNQVGTSWGDYVAKLDDNASYLGRLGLRVVDVGELLQFELLQADGIGPVRTLSSAVDAAVEAPGLPLVFSRVFPASISQRYEVGPLGRGWAHNWQLSLTNASDGTVTITGPAGSRRVFQPDSRNGNYFTQAGDHAALVNLGSGAFKLTEVNGLAYAFGADGKLNYIEDPNGNRITAGYTGGQLTSLSHSSGQYLQIGYANGRIQTVTDSVGRLATFYYDGSAEHLTVSRDYANRYTTNSYVTGQGLAREHALQSIAYPGGTHQYYSFDASGRMFAAWRDGSTEPVWFGYDLGKVMATNGVQKVTKHFFDHRGLLAKTENALGQAVYLARDNQFNLTSTTDPAGRSYGYGYDTRGNVTASSDPLRNATRFTYTTDLNRLSTLQDANWNYTDYGYDSRGNLGSITYADNSAERWGHDSLGNTLVWTNRRGQPIYYTNDVNGRLIAKLYPSGRLISYGYDLRGNLTNAATADPVQAVTNIIQLRYDAKDQLTNIVYPKGRWLAFSYYDSGQRASLQDHLGHRTDYHYDSAGRLQTLTDESSTEVIRYFYDSAGRLSGKKTANGNYTTNLFDDAGQLLHLINYKNNGSVNSRFDYTYDSRGRRKTMGTLDGNWTYNYDDLGQLTNAVFVSSNVSILNQYLTYIYDPLGNRLSTISNGVVTAYVPNELNQYERVGNTTNSYDADGNLRLEISPSGTTSYTFDEENWLVSVTSTTGTIELEYDALGNCSALLQNGCRTEYVFDPAGLGNVTSEYESNGSLAAFYVHGLDLTSRRGTGDGLFYEFDGSCSVVGITSDMGTMVNRYAYLPFGSALSKEEATTNLYQYAGQWGALRVGDKLTQTRSRHISTAQGRFISTEPILTTRGEKNPYRVCRNDPINFCDPDGATAVIATKPIVSGGLLGPLAASCYQWGQVFSPKRSGSNIELLHEHVVFGKRVHIPGVGYVDNIGFGPEGFFSYDRSKAADRAQLEELQPRTGSQYDDDVMAEAVSLVVKNWNDYNRAYFGIPFDYADNCQSFVSQVLQTYALLYGQRETRVAASQDPNDKLCPAGYGTNGFIRANSLMPYMIRFENDTNATAPAQQVSVVDPLSTNLDWTSFELTEIGFGDHIISVPAHSQYFETTVPMSYNGVNFRAEVLAGIDLQSGQAYAKFYSIDPLTGLPPSVNIGFLPPENGTGCGQGQLSFAIKTKTNLPTGTQIRNVATISFDNQTAIATNQREAHNAAAGTDPAKECLNTIDNGAPSSHVWPLPASTNRAVFLVRWSGEDDGGGSGIASYDVYVATNGGAWQKWLAATTNSAAEFTAAKDGAYDFYSVARDNVGNVESKTLIAEAQTVTSVCDITLTPASAQITAKGGSNTVTVTTQSGCSWAVANTNTWITVLSGSNGSGNGTIRYRTSANTNLVLRSGNLIIAGQVFAVVQNGMETTQPKLTITNGPAASAKLTNALVTLRGTATDKIGVLSVQYRVINASGASGWVTAAGTSQWTVALPTLITGTNTVRLRAQDKAGNYSPEQVRTFTLLAPLKVTITGCGNLSPNASGTTFQEMGKRISIEAKPCSGSLFSNWTGGVFTNAAKLSFTMPSNLVLQANFVTNRFVTAKGTFNGLFYEEDKVRHECSGFLALTLTDQGSYSGNLQAGGQRYTLSGKFSVDGTATNYIGTAKPHPLGIQLALSGAESLTGAIRGSLSNEVWAAKVVASKNSFDEKKRPAPNVGQYTIVIAGTNGNALLPGGDGYGTLSVSKAGTVQFAGILAEGTKVSQSASLSTDGIWPVYVPIYGGRGSVLSWIAFTNAASLGGDLAWTKPATTTAYYPTGFVWMTEALGSRYVPPGRGLNAWNATNSQLVLILEGGNLVEAVSNSFTLDAKHGTSSTSLTNKLVLTFTPSSGLFSGSQVEPGCGKTIKLNGVLLQNRTNALGYFLGTNQAGRVELKPK